ncbi:LamG-like jellyroll fold domain-containing protein [Lewinella sp. IMCC34191]|uniref:LamG-like jellyroll fold domain-containing protein n=1 Tax=Lewinella sp. IMCC34191 TaxID=2259172 RepID=UPI0018E5A0CC|nr:LamG-like jellyroll fold domain-containing protein [Lewinella sp. IMCC34191]
MRTALAFDGIDDHVVLDPSFAGQLSNRQQLTMEIRFTFNALKSYDAIFAFRDYRGYRNSYIFELQTSGGGGNRLATNISNGTEDFREAWESQMEIGKEILVSVVFDGTLSRAKDRTKMYIDGVEQRLTGGNRAPSRLANISPSIPIYIGREVNRYSNITVSELRFWSTARTASEISTYAVEESIDPYDADLLASYTFNMDYNEQYPAILSRLNEASGKPYSGTLNNFAYFGSTSNYVTMAAVLPVDVVTFTGETAARDNQLEWTVMAESDVHYYMVERSSDGGESWEPISTILARANGAFGTYTYKFSDLDPAAGAYYRLQIVDFDGTSSISEVIYLQRFSQESFGVHPNPTSDAITINLPSRGEVMLELSDLAGRRIWIKKYVTEESVLRETADAPPGLYVLTARAAGENWSKRLVVR